MPMRYFVTTKSALGVKTNPKQFKTIEEALDGAGVLLGDGEPLAWIVDGDGNLVLPADQVRVRLNRPSEVSRRAI
jgi:hypothetical protein